MKAAVVTIIKNENRYIRENILHNLNIGFDNVILIDNNDEDGENPEDVIGDLILGGGVILVKSRYNGQHAIQMSVYEYVFERFKHQFDWIAYFDADEFLFLNAHHTNIKEYLSDPCFNEFDCIHINWKVYDDNDLIYYEDKPVVERFCRPLNFRKCITYQFPENSHIKSIIRTNKFLNHKIVFQTPHHIESDIPFNTCDNWGVPVRNLPFVIPQNHEYAELRHYQTMSMEEYFMKRYNRTHADANVTWNLEQKRKWFFDRVNNDTEEKRKLFEEFEKKYNKQTSF